MAVDLNKLIDFDLLKRYDTNMKTWVQQTILKSSNLVFAASKTDLPEVGNGNVLYIVGNELYYWDGGQYIQLTGSSSGTGANGKSAYEIAVEQGFEGTEAEWLLSLQGADGKSAYEVAIENGFTGTEGEWLASLKGTDGVSPTVTVTTIENGNKIDITDKDGSHSFNVMNGVDGYSPVVSLETTTNGTTVTITDKNGNHVFEIENGTSGDGSMPEWGSY